MDRSESLRGGRLSAVAFALATIAIYAASVQVRGLLPGLAAAEVVAWGLALDLVVVGPVL